MRDLVNLLLAFGVLFGASTAIALGVALALRRFRRPFLPPENAKIRLRTGSAVYRCRFVGEGARGWRISAPIQRDSYVPLDPGQAVSCEATTAEGVVLFDSRVVGRLPDDGLGATLLLKPPREVRRLDRRSDDRRSPVGRTDVFLDDSAGVLLDLSTGGAKVRIARPMTRNREVRLKLPDGRNVGAVVVESDLAMGGAIVRVRFPAA